ncbi:S66 peptidase family protein [Prolixibacter denitrificans]|uniref:Muramoyltetrapeptide carboxypeptidase n=1 Tax=Prolixibacter denitrificans TaxID=1541063 RepID=A0A2P8CHX8_9BACT|nr:LD-carboxypeptidase [Prolixibacter denitrificans]PSK84571.1 muramoyltetrapeptide carboxypeptidase [Prolixibacter denitrificans]GET20739.1 peptidase U61 [Prolixibacter denitrificans]
MIYPPYLKVGDKIAIVSPAGKVNPEIVKHGAMRLREEGFEVEIGENAFAQSGVFAGTDAERAGDMQKALDDDLVKAILFARGGYGSLRTHQLLDWRRFLQRPKWLIGFSDITVFHAFLFQHGIASIHGVMTAFFDQEGTPSESFRLTIDLLKGKIPWFKEANHPLNRAGEASGSLIGGNLSMIYSLRGTPLDLSPEGNILFIEDLAEYHYHLDRMMMNLKVSGILAKLSGLVVGHFSDMKDGDTGFEKEAAVIIKEAVDEYDYPVMFGFPAGHIMPNYPLIMGAETRLVVGEKESRLSFKI